MAEAVKMENITKVYPNGVVANNELNFFVEEGEIHALVGENGAGKTTLMKILFGLEEPTKGKITVLGKEVQIHSVAEALKYGLGMVQQHFMLVPSMTVAENILLGAEPTNGLFLDMEAVNQLTEELCKKYGFNIDVHAKVQDLPVGDMQKVEILKVLYRKAKIIILDEPTAVLTPQETKELFVQLKLLKKEGHTIVFISHKLDEVKELCDRVTVLRKAKTIGTYHLAEVSIEEISEYMMGHEVFFNLDDKKETEKKPCLRVRNLNYVNNYHKEVIQNISFDLRSGEILSIVGVEGNGQQELVDLISGMLKPQSGKIELFGQDIVQLSIAEIRDLSYGYVPKERMTMGIVADYSITENIATKLYQQPQYNKGPFVKWKNLAKLSEERISSYAIKTDSEKTPIKMLSGGNIQKVVVAREFLNAPQFIIADNPTRGIDVGAANLIHKEMVKLRNSGSAILLITSDLNEVMSLADHILVIYNGKFSAYFGELKNIKIEDLGYYMLGVKVQEAAEVRRCIHD